ncbi:MAG: magnesium/cobalt transporter CorA [Bacteroidales bacterium]|jgi:magnesium transporter|nr:magnesium/cobalt transporter CorA [Bacteroidales bacterium]
MARFLKKSKEEIGISPDELIFRGEKKIDDVLLRVIDYDANNLKEVTINSIEEVVKYQEKETVTWFNVDGLHNTEILKEIANEFNLDHLILADVMNTQAQPTIKEYDNCIFLSIKMVQQVHESGLMNFENLSIILTRNFLISFQERKGDVFEPLRERIRKQKRRIRNGGTDYLLFALLDIVIDNYLYIISSLGEKIETLEENLFPDPKREIIGDINAYKRELNYLRKNINPAKEMILGLSKLESEFIDESTEVHFKELIDNINQAIDSSESYREILSDQLNIYHTTVSSKLNDIMKFLTVFSVIFIPLTFIAGIYGTNFDFIPELHYKYSYFIMWGIIILIGLGMLGYFRNKKWL